MRIRDFTVPEPILEEYRRLVDHVADELLVSFARDYPAVASGFRLNRSAAPRIRQLLRREINSGHKAPEPLLAMLAEHCGVAWSLEAMAEAKVTAEADALAAVIGPEYFAAGALLDPREAVYAAGVRVAGDLEACRNLTDDRRDRVRTLIDEIAGPFSLFLSADEAGLLAGEDGDEFASEEIDAVDEEADADDTPLPDARRDELVSDAIIERCSALRHENEQLRAELSDRGVKARQLKAVEDKLHALQGRQEAVERDRDAARREADEARARAERASRERDAVRAEIEAVKAGMAAEVDRRAAEKQRAELHAWVAGARAVEVAAGREAAAADLLERVASALGRQREQDRLSGNVAQVRQRLDRLRKALVEVREAAAQAIRPLPDLADLEQELDREIDQVASLIETGPARPSATATALAARINAAPDGEVEGLGRLLDGMAAAALLRGPELDALYRVYHRRLDLLYLAAGPKVIVAAAEADPFWRVQRAFGGGERMALLIDGHNVLFLLDDLFSPYYEEDQPRARARERLVGLVVRLTGRHPECDTMVFFDGPKETHVTAGSTVKVVYSGGQGDHRADDAIVQQLKYYRGERHPRPRVVVTDDLELRRRARDTGASVMPVRQLGVLLTDLVGDSAPPAPGEAPPC